MIIMAADLASTSGWAVTDPSNPARPILGTIKTPAPRFEGDYEPRFASMWMQFRALFEQHQPDLFVYEAALVFGRGSNKPTNIHTLRLLNGYTAIAGGCAFACGIPDIREANNQEVRKHFLGSAHGEREALKRATVKRCVQLGWSPNDDNEADAAAIWDMQVHVMRVNKRLAPALAMGGAR